MTNQNPEQLARDLIDQMLIASGWIIQNKKAINLAAGIGVAVREYQTDIGPADYVLFVDRKPAGVIEAKRAEEGESLTMHEGQTEGYLNAKMLVAILQRMGPDPKRTDLAQAALTMGEVDLGLGQKLSFGGATDRRQASDQVYYTVVRGGQFVPLQDGGWEAWLKR